MTNYQEDVTITLRQNAEGNRVTWMDANNNLYVTNDGHNELIVKGTKEWFAIMKKYAPRLIPYL
jgi:hypothetical protein